MFKCRECLFSLTFSALFSFSANEINHNTALDKVLSSSVSNTFRCIVCQLVANDECRAIEFMI